MIGLFELTCIVGVILGMCNLIVIASGVYWHLTKNKK